MRQQIENDRAFQLSTSCGIKQMLTSSTHDARRLSLCSKLLQDASVCVQKYCKTPQIVFKITAALVWKTFTESKDPTQTIESYHFEQNDTQQTELTRLTQPVMYGCQHVPPWIQSTISDWGVDWSVAEQSKYSCHYPELHDRHAESRCRHDQALDLQTV